MQAVLIDYLLVLADGIGGASSNGGIEWEIFEEIEFEDILVLILLIK